MTLDPSIFDGRLVRSPWFYEQWRLAGNPAVFLRDLSGKFGDYFHYRGLLNFYLINHPALVKQILLDTHESFDKCSSIYDRFRNVFGNGLVVAEGERWRRKRKALQPLFGPATIKQYFEGMVDSTHRMLDRWEKTYLGGGEFNIAPHMNRLTLAIAGRALFSHGFDGGVRKIEAWTEVINHYSAKPPLPIIRSFWFPSPLNIRLKRNLREFHSFIRSMIEQRRNGNETKDLLGILMAAKWEENSNGMDDPEIIDEVLGMIIGGHETSSSALTWLWYELSQNPEVEFKLLQELASLGSPHEFTLEMLPKLRFTRMVLDETMRLHPPFWFENRNVAQETHLGGVVLPKGALVVFSRYALHRHPCFWRDPDRFDPSRFEPGQEEHKRTTHAYIPFGGGPRICIGIHFAMMELLVVVAMTLRRFRVVLGASDRHQMAAKLTMHPKNGVRVRLERRND